MKKTFLALLFAAFAVVGSAQFVQLDNIKNSKFTGVDPIVSGEDGQIEGYCTYYVLDKGEKGEKIFEFSIIDKDLVSIKKTQLSIHRSAEINNTIFNGQFLLVSIDDVKNKQIKLYVIDKNGKVVVDKSIPTEKRRLADSKVYADINGEGFYVISPIDGKKIEGYSISKVDNNLEQLWKIEETQAKGRKEVLDLISTEDRFVIWANSFVGSKVKPSIVGYDTKSGKKIFEKDGYDGTSTMLYNQLRLDKDNNIYAGGSYVNGEKISGVNNDGIYLLKLNSEGKEVLYNKVDNKEKIQDVLKKTNGNFSLGSKDKVLVEDLFVHGDDIIVISEMFRKNTNMTPSTIQAARDLITGKYVGSVGGGSSASEKGKVVMDIRDFIFFKFNQQGDLVEIMPGLKEDNNKITCWYPFCNLAGMSLAKSLKEVGWFDYAFETKDKNNHSILVCKDNVSGSKPRLYTYNLDNNYMVDKLDLKQQAKVDLSKGKVGYFNAIKNENGKMVLVYYQRKLQRISLSLESL